MNGKQELIDKSSPIPAYHQILNDMMGRINKNEWKIGDRLPSEPVLSTEYGVSRVTIRQAMAELEKRFIIARHQGKGAYLIGSPKPFVEDLNLPSVRDVRAPHLRNQSTILELRLDHEPPQYVTEVFAADEANFPLVYLCRIFSKNGYPIGLNHAWFPAVYVPRLVEEGLIDTSVTATLKLRYNYTISRVDNIIEATKANAQEAPLLSVPYDASLLRIQSTHFAEDKLIQFSNTLWVGELTRFRFSAR